MATAADSSASISCADFLQFEDTLKKMRTIDDKIIYELNTLIPTDSFAKSVDVAKKCEALYKQLRSGYNTREQAINKCIALSQTNVAKFREEKMKRPDDVDLLKKLRAEQSKLRLLQSELNVEEVVKDRSLKAISVSIPRCFVLVFYERCRNAYKPPDFVPS